jgi:hypothetical protein
MLHNDQQLQTTLERIAWFQQQVAHLRPPNPTLLIIGRRFPASLPKWTACSWRRAST